MILALHDLPLLFHVLPAVSLGHCAQHSYLCEKYVCVSFQRSVVYNRSCILLRPCAQHRYSSGISCNYALQGCQQFLN